MAARALLIVPPFIKYDAGPLLGPALLQAAAKSSGQICSVLDLNALWIQDHRRHLLGGQHERKFDKPFFQGDHNKPLDNSLTFLEQLWAKKLLNGSNLEDPKAQNLWRSSQFGFFNHDEIQSRASQLASSSFGSWVCEYLIRAQLDETFLIQKSSAGPPQVVGLSLLHAGQVIPAAAITALARKVWPGCFILWGGPHVTGLGKAISQDLGRRQALAADLFIQGHAEETFVEVLNHIGSQSRQLPPVLQARRGKINSQPIVPLFENLDWYRHPLTLPVQASLGCAYGKCAFCTYPKMEGKPVLLSIEETVGNIVRQAIKLGAQKCSGISLKDSLVTTNRLRDIAQCVRGQVHWSACTKLSPRLADGRILKYLSDNGLMTLEVGLESLLPDTQRRIGKVQAQSLFQDFVAQVCGVPDLSLVVNYMTGFPFEDPGHALEKLVEVQELVDGHLNSGIGFTGRSAHQSVALRGKVEHNIFELERLSPMAQNPSRYGIDTKKLRLWPWASVIEKVSN